jgi:hypothetical protein
MKTFKIIPMLLLAFMAVTANAATCWRIVNGDGAGVVLVETERSGNQVFVYNSDFWAQGAILLGHFSDCECTGFAGHYHGFLFGEDDGGDGCGWGCVEEIPCDLAAALTYLDLTIANIVRAPVRTRLVKIRECAETARENKIGSLLDGAMSAMGNELASSAFDESEAERATRDAVVRAIAPYAAFAQAEITATNPPPAPLTCCKVDLLLRLGSGSESKLVDAGRKYTARPGQIVTFEATGCPGNGPFQWEYQFKGAGVGEIPSGTGVGFVKNRINIISERTGSVKVTVSFRCPDGREVKDTITVTYQ